MADKAERRHPSHIQATLDAKDAEGMQAEMVARYGFRLNDQFVTDLRKYAGKKQILNVASGKGDSLDRGEAGNIQKGMPSLVASKDVETVKGEYRALYNQEISDQYAGDLIAYFEKAGAGE